MEDRSARYRTARPYACLDRACCIKSAIIRPAECKFLIVQSSSNNSHWQVIAYMARSAVSTRLMSTFDGIRCSIPMMAS